MNVLSKPKKVNNTPKKSPLRGGKTSVLRAVWFVIGILLLFITGFCVLSPLLKDAGKIDYFDYVSELRSNVLIAETENFSLRAYAVKKEYPYAADGVRRETSERSEIYLVAPSGDKSVVLSFSLSGKNYGGEMSYDNVKEEYFYSVSADLSTTEALAFTVEYGTERLQFQAKTVKKQDTLSPRAVLEKLMENEPTTFEALTDENGFVGEIYLRLITDDEPYYYVGLVEKSGKIHAYLLTANTGKVLAKRES